MTSYFADKLVLPKGLTWLYYLFLKVTNLRFFSSSHRCPFLPKRSTGGGGFIDLLLDLLPPLLKIEQFNSFNENYADRN